MYVTDKEIRFEDKNIKARTIPNFFNIGYTLTMMFLFKFKGQIDDIPFSTLRAKS